MFVSKRSPNLIIYRHRVEENASTVVELCKSLGIKIVGVTKGVSGNLDIARAMIRGGCYFLGDSRLRNIANLRANGIKAPCLLLRLPKPSEIDEIVLLANCSLISMPETVKLLEEACCIHHVSHDVIVMVDVGDLREGILPYEVEKIAKFLKQCKRVHCIGVGTNVGCFGGVLPYYRNLSELVNAGNVLEMLLGYPLGVYSGGGTSSLALIENKDMPTKINQLRIGEAILLGSDTTRRRIIPYLRQDTMVLEAEVIEVRKKPSIPIGPIGVDAFGNVPAFENRGVRLRAILAIGRQDVRPEGLFPLIDGVNVLGASSDHLILDIEESKEKIFVGDIIPFRVNYGSLLAATTSHYVNIIVR